MIRRSVAAGLGLAVSIALAGCGGSGTSQAPSAAPSSEPSAGGAAACEQAASDADFAQAVSIKNFTMNPATVTIRVDEAVAWTNDDSATHTATMDSGDCSTDNIASGTTAKLVFHVAGTYTYHCRIHSSTMTGFTIEVTP